MRKEGIGYLPQFDNTEHTIYKLLNFYMEKRGRVELRRKWMEWQYNKNVAKYTLFLWADKRSRRLYLCDNRRRQALAELWKQWRSRSANTRPYTVSSVRKKETP